MQFSISLAALPILLLGTLGSALPAVEPRGLPNAQLVCGPFFETTTVDNINKLAYQFKQRAWSGWIRGQVQASYGVCCDGACLFARNGGHPDKYWDAEMMEHAAIQIREQCSSYGPGPQGGACNLVEGDWYFDLLHWDQAAIENDGLGRFRDGVDDITYC